MIFYDYKKNYVFTFFNMVDLVYGWFTDFKWQNNMLTIQI